MAWLLKPKLQTKHSRMCTTIQVLDDNPEKRLLLNGVTTMGQSSKLRINTVHVILRRTKIRFEKLKVFTLLRSIT
uniref:Uncharacterized protein n=1 Tax=Arundo donax TaxID=35708 RepID=A0A0A9E569_ARUDO